MNTTIKIIAALFISGLLFSCSPYSKILKRNPLTATDSLKLAKRCAITYPAVIVNTRISDTIIVPDYERAYKAENELMQTIYALAECRDSKGNQINMDSLIKTIRVPVPEIKYVRITETVRDSAAVSALQILLRETQMQELEKRIKLTNQIDSLTADNSHLRKSRNRYRAIVWGLIGVFGIGLILKLKFL